MKIHPTAIISPDAKLEEGVEIGPYSIIGSDVKIGKNTIIGPHAVIDDYTHIGEELPYLSVLFHRCSSAGLEIRRRKNPCCYRQFQHYPGICDNSPLDYCRYRRDDYGRSQSDYGLLPYCS